MIQVVVIKACHDVGLSVPALLDLGHRSLVDDHRLSLRDCAHGGSGGPLRRRLIGETGLFRIVMFGQARRQIVVI